MIGIQVKEFTGLNIDEFKPVNFIKNAKVPAMFLHAKEDEIVALSHTDQNFDAYGFNEKSKITFKGTHNSLRPADIMAFVYENIKMYAS